MKVKQVLTDNLDLDAENIVKQRTHRVGSKKPGKLRSIVAKFQSYKDREKDLPSEKKAKGVWSIYQGVSQFFQHQTNTNHCTIVFFSKRKKKSLSTSKNLKGSGISVADGLPTGNQ